MRDVDERGIPVVAEGASSADFCPDKPCELCTGSAADGTPSFEWCTVNGTCAATIDWDKVYQR